MKLLILTVLSVAFAQSPDTENPNGYDPLFDWNVVSGNDFLAKYNVTYTDLINKPIQLKILLQTLYEQGQKWYELNVQYANEWVEEFSANEVNSRVMINWGRDMEDIIEETMEIVRWGMEDMEQIIYPWGIYETSVIEKQYITPYLDAIVKTLSWAGEMTYRYWEMLFGLNGWVPTGLDWVEEWETDFQWHRLSEVTRELRRFTEEWKVNFEVSIDIWEDIICGPRVPADSCKGQCPDEVCAWKTIDLGFISEYTFDYLLIIIDKLDEALEWFALVIGNILDATVNKDPTGTRTQAQ